MEHAYSYLHPSNVVVSAQGATLRLEGLDLIDGTPVLDVKPYIAAYDAVPKASLPKWARG